MAQDPSEEAYRETVKRTDAAPAAPTSLAAGQAVGRFTLESLLGRGGMGEVWKARDPGLGRFVAIKFLLGADLDDEKRFLNEAQTVAGLGHPHIAAVFETGRHAGRSFIVMQFLEGTTIDRAGLPLPEILKAIRDAARVLEFAHQRGVVHRDVKPTNLMVARGEVFVMDFGLARRTEARSSVSRSGTIVGTPAYMSPEQVRGSTLDARTDVYSLGATLYELLTRRPPFVEPELIPLLEKIATAEPVGPRQIDPGIPREIETIVLKAMEKEAGRRYPSAAALADDLDRYLAGKPILARPAGLLYKWGKHVRRNPVAWGAAAVAVTVALVAGSLLISGSRRREAERRTEVAARTEAADLCRRASESVKEAKVLLRVRKSRRPEWETLYDRSLALADEAIRKYPDLAGGYFTKGEILESQCAWGEAAEAYDRAIERDPKLADAWIHRCLCRLELYQEAAGAGLHLERYGAAREGVDVRRQRADSFKDGAASDLAEAGRLGAASPRDRRYAEAQFLLLQAKYAAAEQICDELLRESGTDERVWFVKARSQGARNHIAEAVVTLDTLLADVMPHFSRAYHARALYKARLDDPAGARDDFALAIDRDPKSWRSYFGLARARAALRDWPGAIAGFGAGLKLRPGDSNALLGRGEARLKTGDLDGAIADFTAALEADPTATGAHYDRGMGRLRKGDRAGAVEDFTKAGETALRAPPREPARRELTRVQEFWSKSLEADPADGWASFQRAILRRDTRDAPGALADASQAVASNGLFAPAWRLRASLRAAAGDAAGAKSDLDRALEVDPKLPK